MRVYLALPCSSWSLALPYGCFGSSSRRGKWVTAELRGSGLILAVAVVQFGISLANRPCDDGKPLKAVPQRVRRLSKSFKSGTASSPSPLATPTLPGEPIAFDEHGVPIIVRSVELGQSRHYVLNEDGKWHTFGDRTVDSLMESREDTAREWLGALSHRDVRGLVHELGQRLLKSSQLYQKQQGVLEFICDMADYAFFGLTSQCSERELDNAYRKMAKKMHPDKNGGTEMAKKRFQHMKERYESLKARRGAGPSPPEEEEDSEEPKPESDTGRIEFDPFDRKSLDQTAGAPGPMGRKDDATQKDLPWDSSF
eukprot:s1670_g13.t1